MRLQSSRLFRLERQRIIELADIHPAEPLLPVVAVGAGQDDETVQQGSCTGEPAKPETRIQPAQGSAAVLRMEFGMRKMELRHPLPRMLQAGELVEVASAQGNGHIGPDALQRSIQAAAQPPSAQGRLVIDAQVERLHPRIQRKERGTAPLTERHDPDLEPIPCGKRPGLEAEHTLNPAGTVQRVDEVDDSHVRWKRRYSQREKFSTVCRPRRSPVGLKVGRASTYSSR